METVENLLNRYRKADKIKRQWRSLLEEAYELAIPNRNTYSETVEGASKNTEVFDATLQNSLLRGANKLQANLMPPFQKWARLTPGPVAEFRGDSTEQQQAELDDVRDLIFAYLHVSNLDVAIHEALIEFLISTGVLLIQPGTPRNPFDIEAIPQLQVTIEIGPGGMVTAVFRRWSIPAYFIEEQWPDHGPLPTEIQKCIEDPAERQKKVEFLECTYREAERLWHYNVIVDGSPQSSEYDFPSEHSSAFSEGGEGEKSRIVERETRSNPFVIFRHTRVAGETYGRGPVLTALPTAQTLNKTMEIILKSSSISMGGVFTYVNDGMFDPNNVKFEPGALIPVRSNSTGGVHGPSIQQLPFSTDLQTAQFDLDKLGTMVRQIMMDKELPPMDGAVRSPTEILARQREIQMDDGAAFGRMKRELIIPSMQRFIDIAVELGILDPGEDGELVIDGSTIDVQVISPLAQAQDLGDVEQLVNMATILQNLAGPQATMLALDIENLGPTLGDKLGVESDFLRDEQSRAALMQVMAQQMAQGQQPIGAEPANNGGTGGVG